MCQKHQISLGTIVTSIQDSKPCEKQISPTFSYFLINNALLYHFVANGLAYNKKMTEKSVFREAWSPELTSQSFPVPCFWSRGFVPHRKWNLMLLAHQNTGKENRYLRVTVDDKMKFEIIIFTWQIPRCRKVSINTYIHTDRRSLYSSEWKRSFQIEQQRNVEKKLNFCLSRSVLKRKV